MIEKSCPVCHVCGASATVQVNVAGGNWSTPADMRWCCAVHGGNPLADAVAVERERCAKIAETLHGEGYDAGYILAGQQIAAAIRKLEVQP